MFYPHVKPKGRRSFAAALDDFRKDSADWFDGTVIAVDRRMAKCGSLLHSAQAAAAHDPAAHLGAIAELSADHTALKNLRQDLLSAASGRETKYVPPSRRTAGKSQLAPEDRRWVTLESAKFFSSQEDAHHDVAEMAERARRHAAEVTSALPPARARSITAAFEEAVAGQARLTPKPRTASRKRPIFTDFPDSQMFL